MTLNYPELLEKVAAALPADLPVYLVGGSVRDLLLGRPVHDLDFVLPGDALRVARQLANRIGASYFPLDEERKTARLVIQTPGRPRDILDFAALRGPDLDSDLRLRDFTINAIAVNVHQLEELIDPLGGQIDLRAKRIQASSTTSFQDDPVRIVRAVRLAAALHFSITLETRQLMHQASSGLVRISPERLRDELFKILDGPQPAACIRSLDILGVLKYVLPELEQLKGEAQSPPHISDVWTHTMEAVQRLSALLDALSPEYQPETADNLAFGLAVLRLGRFRQQIGEHFRASLNPERSLRSLLILAAFYHDTGKPKTRQVDENGRIRFFEHEDLSKRLVEHRGRELRLSSSEVNRLGTIAGGHMRPLLLSQDGKTPSKRAIYRFFRSTAAAGVDICLLSLADMLSTYGPTLDTQQWAHHLEVIRTLLEAWWDQAQENVAPQPLINGNDLMSELNIKPGQVVGQLLEDIREAQVMGQVSDRSQALALAKQLLEKKPGELDGANEDYG